MNKTDKSSIFKSSLLAALLGAAFGAHAAGLGKLTVYSAIGQPLSAEVALTASQEELSGLSAKLASHSAFTDAGIDFMPVLSNVRFNVAKLPDGKAVLRLTTDNPLNEPFLHFLVELNWTAGRMVREYTFLLDPPEMLQVAKPASVVAPVAPPVQAATKPAPIKATPLPGPSLAAPATAPSADKSAGAEHRVKLGETLSKVARENRIEAVSLDQMLVALFNNNRDAFDGNNMNRLRAGKILRLPTPAEAARVDAGEARKLIVSQAADFNAYRRRLADAAGTAAVAESALQQEATGKIKPQMELKAPPAPAADKLEVSRTETAKTAKAGSGKSSLEEDLIARDKSLREASERIAQLEKNLESLKHLVELKSQPAAQMQQQAQVAAAAKPAEEKKPEPPAAKAAEPAPAPAPVATAPVAEKPAEPVAQPAPAAEAPVEAAKPVEVAPAPAKPPAPPKPAAKKPLPPPPPPEPSFVEDNPELVFGGGGLIALLLGYFGYTAWRKKKLAREESSFDNLPSVLESDLASKSGTVFGAASESVDNGEVSIQGDFSEGGVLTTEESVDPVAEADVLMAYGRDSQAEEILKEGLKTDPTRAAIHLKLLEVYSNRKNAQQFEAVAGDLHALSHGQGAEWEKATALAAGLGLSGGLFPAVAVTASEPEPVESGIAPEPIAEQASSEPVNLSAVPPAAEEVVPPAEEDVGSLDFDLDLGTTSGPALAAAAEQAAEKPAADEVMSLDFDFDLGTPEAPAETAPEAAVEPAPAADANAIDFSIDVGDVAPEAPVAVAEQEQEHEQEAGEIAFDLDLGSTDEAGTEVAVAAEEVAPVPEAGDLSAVGIDFDLDLGSDTPAAEDMAAEDMAAETPAPVEPAPAELGLADISLDLGEPDTEASPSIETPVAEIALPEVELLAPDVAPVAISEADLPLDIDALGGEASLPQVEAPAHLSMDLPEINLETPAPASLGESAEAPSVADDPEVATKLELAQAYEEMGDREGARELLTEVLAEGSAAQQTQARSRLDQLDA